MEVLRGEQDDLGAAAGIDIIIDIVIIIDIIIIIIIDIELKSPPFRRSEGHIVSDYDIRLCETFLETLTDSSHEVS